MGGHHKDDETEMVSSPPEALAPCVCARSHTHLHGACALILRQVLHMVTGSRGGLIRIYGCLFPCRLSLAPAPFKSRGPFLTPSVGCTGMGRGGNGEREPHSSTCQKIQPSEGGRKAGEVGWGGDGADVSSSLLARRAPLRLTCPHAHREPGDRPPLPWALSSLLSDTSAEPPTVNKSLGRR